MRYSLLLSENKLGPNADTHLQIEKLEKGSTYWSKTIKCVYLGLRSKTGHPETLKHSFSLHLSSPGAELSWNSLGTEVFIVGSMQQTLTSWICQHVCSPTWGGLLTPTCFTSESKPEGSSEKLARRRSPMGWLLWDVSSLFLIAQWLKIHVENRRGLSGKKWEKSKPHLLSPGKGLPHQKQSVNILFSGPICVWCLAKWLWKALPARTWDNLVIRELPHFYFLGTGTPFNKIFQFKAIHWSRHVIFVWSLIWSCYSSSISSSVQSWTRNLMRMSLLMRYLLILASGYAVNSMRTAFLAVLGNLAPSHC